MGDTLSEFEEFLNWKKGKQSQERQEGILGEIRDYLKALTDKLPGSGEDDEGDGGEGGPPPPPAKSRAGGNGGEGGGTAKRQSRWFGEATG